MSKKTGFFRHNQLYIILAVFILLVNLFALAEGHLTKHDESTVIVNEEATSEGDPDLAEEGRLFDKADIEARQKKLLALAEENPNLYLFLGLLNLFIIFLILIGFLIDVYLLVKVIRKDQIDIKVTSSDIPRWGVGDVLRVAILFFSFGYLFVMLQNLIAKYIPIFYNENFRMIFNTAIMNIVCISVIAYFIVKKYGQKMNTLGITFKGFKKSILYAGVGYLALLPVLLVIMVATYFVTKWLSYQPPAQPIVQIFMEEKQTSILWFSALFAAIFGPIAEEIFFRGFMYNAIKKNLGILGSVIITSVIFAFLHAHIVGVMPIIALGILLSYLYEKTGSLVAPIMVHITHNVGMVTLVFLMRNVGT